LQLKIQYHSQQERENIINEHSSLILVEEQNISEGNFLIFSDSPPEQIVENVYTNVPQSEIEAMKQSIAELTLLIATLGG
jgi:hypothetical protein